jgi:hypothetical protein
VYLRRVQADIDDIAKELHRLDKRAAAVRETERADFQRQVRALWRKERLARVQLEQLKHASESQWQKLRNAENSTVVHLRKSYRYMMNHIPQ